MKRLTIDYALPFLLKDAHYPAGGWAVQLKELLQGLSHEGHRGGVLTWTGANAYVGLQDKCELLETYDQRQGTPKLRLIREFIPIMLARARAFGPDVVVQSCSAYETGMMAYIARRLGVPFVHRLASDTDSDLRYRSYLCHSERIVFRLGLASADLVICQNDYQAERMKARHPRKPRLLLPNAIHIPTGEAWTRPRAERPYVAWLATFRFQKNLPLLHRIASRMSDITFRVAGALPELPDAESLDAIAALRTLPNVEMADYVNRRDVNEFLSRAALLLCTSRYEGFSNTFLEAFSAGTPVETGAGVDPSNIIANNALGGVAAGEDEMVRQVRRIWEMDAADFSALSRRCRMYVEANHTAAAMVPRLIDRLRPLVEIQPR